LAFCFYLKLSNPNPATVVPAEVILFPHHRQYLTLMASANNPNPIDAFTRGFQYSLLNVIFNAILFYPYIPQK
jgi:hypothetical protein